MNNKYKYNKLIGNKYIIQLYVINIITKLI